MCQFSAACGGAASFMIDVCTRRGYSALTNFQMSFLKPLVPAWLHAGWSRITREPAMVLRGWDSCGPGRMFDERRPEVVRDAKRAVHDTSHPSDPLFPKRDQRALPEGHDGAILTEPEMEPVVDLPADVQSPEELPQLVEAEDPNTVSHVRSVLAAEARTPELQPVAVQGCRVYPLFDLAAQRAQKRARSVDGPAVVE